MLAGQFRDGHGAALGCRMQLRMQRFRSRFCTVVCLCTGATCKVLERQLAQAQVHMQANNEPDQASATMLLRWPRPSALGASHFCL